MVALKAHEAERTLAAPPEGVRLFLIYGNDPGGISERVRLVERIALLRGHGDIVLRFGSDEISADPGRVADEVFSASLFGGEPVISLRVLDGRHNVIGALQTVIERPPDASWLIVEAGELAAASPLRKAFEASSRAIAAPTYQIEGAGLASLIRSAAEEAGLVIEPAAMELLAANLGGDRMANRREIEKLFLYVGEKGPVSAADVAAVIGDTAEFRGDEIIDAALLGDSEALEAGLGRLRAEGSSAAALAAQMLRHLFHLAAIRASMLAGMSAAAAIERARPPIFSRRRATVESQLRRWPAGELAIARKRMADAVALTRRVPALESAAVSAALHFLARRAGRLSRS